MDEGRYSTYDVRILAVEAATRGMPMVDIADAYGIERTTLYRWVKRFERDGQDGLQRKIGSGRPRKLRELDEYDLRRIILQPASSFGYETDLWTVARVHQVIREEYRVVVSKDTIWRRLREAGLTYQKPERQYFEIDEAARERWLRREVPRIRRTVRKFRAILYFQDESNVSLTAFLGKTWAPRGNTPKATVTGRRGGVSAMSAITPRGHLLFQLYEKRIASGEIIAFLAQMLKYHPKRHLVVVMDQAPPHVSQKTRTYIGMQPRLHIFYLPKYSPDWNPDEKVWNHLKHHELKSHKAKTKEQLKQLTNHKLSEMASDRRLMRGIFFRCCVADLFG